MTPTEFVRQFDRAEWQERAACRGLDVNTFYPEFPVTSRKTEPAKAVCRECPVQHQCGQYARQQGERYGIWAGVNMNQYQRNARRRRAT